MSHEIDFAPPTNKLEDVLFPVKLQDIYSVFSIPATLFDQQIEKRISTPNHKAVVNQSSGEIISVVGSNYKLISNEQAIEMGRQIFTQLYPEVKTNDLIPYKVVAPHSKASAHIDFIHQAVDFNVWDQETWLPFLRTTNSYNRSVALSFEIGFVRKLCSNGVLFNKKSIKLKYLHNKGNRVDIKSAANQIRSTSGLFAEQCRSLKVFDIPKELTFALVCQILNINLELPNDNQHKKKINSLQNLIELTKILTTRYTQELGSNGYMVFNVVTDLVSHQDQYKNLTGFYFNVRSFYTKPADWMDDFSTKINTKSVVIEDYLKEKIKSLESIKTQTKLEWMLN